MRSRITIAILFLAAVAAVAAYHEFNLRQYWPFWKHTAGEPAEPAQPQRPYAVGGEAKEADARRQLAFASITERLPKGAPVTPARSLDAEAQKRWNNIDRSLTRSHNQRAVLLKALHERTQRFFIESPGAGSYRVMPESPDDLLPDQWHYVGNTKQPGEPADFPVSPGESLTRVDPAEEYYFYHECGLEDFLYPRGFGYVKDRAHVAGFKPHGFRNLAVPVHESKHWRVHHVHLIGILMHAEPVAYLTDKLPSMEQVRQGKTRPLDFFEEAALPGLRDGEDLYIVAKGDTLRMLGALRATKVCQQCHDAAVGDLLGCLSYTLRPAPKDKDAIR